MKAIVFFAEGFEEVEALSPVDYLRRAGAEVVMVSCSENLQVKGAHGINIVADTTVASFVKQLSKDSSLLPNAVIVPGGMPGASNVASCKEAMQLIDSVAESGGITAAICAAPVVVFAKAGLLCGKRYTCYPGMDAQLEQWAGTEWKSLTKDSVNTKERCVVDGTLITAAGPGAAEEFALALVQMLAGTEVANKVASAAVMR